MDLVLLPSPEPPTAACHLDENHCAPQPGTGDPVHPRPRVLQCRVHGSWCVHAKPSAGDLGLSHDPVTTGALDGCGVAGTCAVSIAHPSPSPAFRWLRLRPVQKLLDRAAGHTEPASQSLPKPGSSPAAATPGALVHSLPCLESGLHGCPESNPRLAQLPNRGSPPPTAASLGPMVPVQVGTAGFVGLGRRAGESGVASLVG